MLTIRATNFGVNPADIQIKYYSYKELLILDGEFIVDTTVEEYAGIRPMQLTVADLPFAESHISTVIAMVESEGVNYATVAKVWVSDQNTINIAKVLPYKSAGSYVIKFSTVLISKYVAEEVVPSHIISYTPEVTKGAATGIELFAMILPNIFILIFKAETLTFDENDDQVVMSIPEFPPLATGSFPIFYNEGLWVALGSKYYPATLANGTLTISKNGNADEATGSSYKFTRAILITNTVDPRYDGDE